MSRVVKLRLAGAQRAPFRLSARSCGGRLVFRFQYEDARTHRQAYDIEEEEVHRAGFDEVLGLFPVNVSAQHTSGQTSGLESRCL